MSTPERLAYWYLRLNGFMTIENFIVHPDSGADQRTDADLLAVRFLCRAENASRTMVDDPKISEVQTFVNLIIAEVKTSTCALNGPWADRGPENIEMVLSSIGCVQRSRLNQAADDLYSGGLYHDDSVTIRLFAFGDQRAREELKATQLLFDEMIDFIFDRFSKYRKQKSSVSGWSEDGRILRSTFESCRSDREAFRGQIRNLFGLPNVSLFEEEPS